MNNNKGLNAKLFDACTAEKADFDLIEELLDKGADSLVMRSALMRSGRTLIKKKISVKMNSSILMNLFLKLS